MTGDSAETVNASQRLDKWLWQARFFKTRTLAAKFVSDGNVRITRGEITQRADKPSTVTRPGDTIVFTRNDRLRIIYILDCAERRGPASEAQTLYEDRSPPPPPKGEASPRKAFARDKGAGRPTKKDRRALSALKAN
ncbi:RNA-binding S4 domain-containing protein [Marinicaulis aureus]|uniref:RNA-binding S4 domain-containing protein n=1 Tax=Hyphococcus aureus TaxID=2666033 RepID=A0ABW1KVS1_9PROT